MRPMLAAVLPSRVWPFVAVTTTSSSTVPVPKQWSGMMIRPVRNLRNRYDIFVTNGERHETLQKNRRLFKSLFDLQLLVGRFPTYLLSEQDITKD